MNWLYHLHSTQPVAHAFGVLAWVSIAGMALGSGIAQCSIEFGAARVRFAGVISGHVGKPVQKRMLDFVKECVTSLPLVLVGILARKLWKMNFIDLSGLLAGGTTNPPALTFATSLGGSDSPSVAYAAVYPLTMLLRIPRAQVLAPTLIR